jgi:hypothetical protein
MVDDKKIDAAAEEYNEKVENELEKKHIPKRTFAERYAESAISECAFKAGAKWAICELLNDLWHPASEKPILRNGKCLVVLLMLFVGFQSVMKSLKQNSSSF